MTVEQPSRESTIQQNDIFLAAVMRGDPVRVRQRATRVGRVRMYRVQKL
jgi:hypothetical protein